MSDDSVERVCEVCGQKIPKWKPKNIATCSVKCKFQLKQAKAKSKREELIEKNPKRSLGTVLHSCLGNSLDPAKLCRCRKRINDDEARGLIAKGEAVSFEDRLAEFVEGAPLLVVGRKLKFPRSATVERPHIERLTQRKARSKDKTLEELQKAVREDRAMRAEEEALRLEIYGELTASARQAWIKEIPADVYDAAERQTWGRPLFTNFRDERTQGGIGVDVDSLMWNREFENLLPETGVCDDETGNKEIEESDDEYEEIRNE